MTTSVFWKRKRAAVAAAGLALVLGAVGFAAGEKASTGSNPPPTFKFADRNEGPSRNSFAPVIKQVLPAVVSVTSTKVVKTSQNQIDPQELSPLFRQFFGDDGSADDNSNNNDRRQNRGNGNGGGQFRFNQPQEQKEEGVGSGVIVSPQGYILTNNHVVDGATTVMVTLSDRREYKARVIGADPRTDVAVIKIEAGNLPTVTIGDSEKVDIGDYAIAIGNPFNVGQTVTMGIVSATHRGMGNQIEEYEDFIQTDAAINPGNSGGALVNDRGELIGINTAIIAHGSSGNQGIGFAVPVNLARNVMDQLIKNGTVTRAYLGIYPQDVTPAIARQFGNRAPGGALVADVSANTPASRGGVERGDIVTEVNGHAVNDANQLRNMISVMDPGAHVALHVIRNGADKNLQVTLEELPKEEAQNGNGRERNNVGKNDSDNALSGVTVEDVTGQNARRLGKAASDGGVVVTSVNQNSAAGEAGLQEGDVIQEVNHQPVKNVADFRRAVRSSNDGTLLLVNHDGRTGYIAL